MTGGAESLAGKAAIVTGASRGLGLAMATALARAGASVALTARDAQRLAVAVKGIGAAGGRVLGVPTDITDVDAVRALVAAVSEAFGRIDVLVNNAGIVASSPLLDHEPEEWDRVMATNLRGTYLLTRAVGPHLIAQGRGKIVNVASSFAFMGVANHAAYCASKAAVVAFTKSMALEWARFNIQVNALAPGYFATDLNAGLRADPQACARVIKAIPARRMGRPDELAAWLLLLAGPASDFMTGQTVVIDGGQSAR